MVKKGSIESVRGMGSLLMRTCSSTASNIVLDKCRAAGLSGHLGRFQCFSNRLKPVVLSNHFANMASFYKCPIILPPSSAIPDSHSQATEIAVDQQGQLSTVRVKFQLQKDCGFGDHFLMVGDDPLIGSWNPENAITLDWSDGHMWSAEVDIPVDITIQFKFILKRRTGDIMWQPGPDRMFKTWTTNKTITVIEDWENAELQKIVEDVTPAHCEEQLLKNSNIVASAVEELRKESHNGMMVAHNIVTDHRRFSSSEEVEDQEFILADPVLVPGLAPAMSNESTNGSPLANKEENTDLNGSIRSRKSKDQTALEEETQYNSYPQQENFKGKKGEPDSVITQERLKIESKEGNTSVRSKREEKGKMKYSDEVQFDNPYLDKVEKQKNTAMQDGYRVLKNDIHWCRKALQSLLSCFGLV